MKENHFSKCKPEFNFKTNINDKYVFPTGMWTGKKKNPGKREISFGYEYCTCSCQCVVLLFYILQELNNDLSFLT